MHHTNWIWKWFMKIMGVWSRGQDTTLPLLIPPRQDLVRGRGVESPGQGTFPFPSHPLSLPTCPSPLGKPLVMVPLSSPQTRLSLGGREGGVMSPGQGAPPLGYTTGQGTTSRQDQDRTYPPPRVGPGQDVPSSVTGRTRIIYTPPGRTWTGNTPLSFPPEQTSFESITFPRTTYVVGKSRVQNFVIWNPSDGEIIILHFKIANMTPRTGILPEGSWARFLPMSIRCIPYFLYFKVPYKQFYSNNAVFIQF